MRIKMQEQNNKTLSYSQQRKLFDSKIQNLKEILLNVSNYTTNNKIINSWLENTTTCISDNDKYYSLIYFYDTYSQINDILQPSSIKQLIYILACMLAEKKFKTNDIASTQLLETAKSKSFNYSIAKGSKIENFIFSLAPIEQNFINFQIQNIILKGMLEELQNKVNNPRILYNRMYDELAAKKNEIQNTLNEYQTKADNLADFIAKQHSKLNFVGLGSAFKTITKEKNTDKNNIEKYLKYYFGALLVIPIIVACALYFQEKPNYYFCIPATTIELIVLYAFRLFYQQYLFVKSELQQVNLRHSLCAFIESYMEFKKDNKDNTVDLFEQLIFSNIISDEKKVPATVDGLDGIAKIIETLKGK